MVDAAIPSHIVKELGTRLLVLIRLPDSPGLRGILQGEEDAGARPEDVRSRPFKVTFPRGPTGKPDPLKVTVKLTSPDFSPPEQAKNVFVPHDADSEVCPFMLTPKRIGSLTVLVELQWEDAVRGHRSLLTKCVAEATDVPAQSEMNLVQMHLSVSADSPGGRAGPLKPSPTAREKTEGGKLARKKAEPRQPDTSGWNKIGPFAIISLISFLLGALLVFFMVWKAEKLVALGLTGKLFYIVLLPLGLSVAGFLFGVVQSYATFKGKQLGGNLVLGGPIVGFFLVVILGFVLVPDPSTFPVTVFVHGPSGPQDTVLQNSGEVLMDLGGDRQKAAIGEQGQAYFRAIPANFRGQEVLAWVSSDKFESAEANKKYKLDGQAIYLAVRRKAGRLYGLVESDDPKCLVGVQLRVAGLAIPMNPDSGRFDVSIPGDHLEDELVLDVTGPGCTPQHINVVPNSNEITITLHRAPAGSAKE